jgi:Cdc6-like AAA superfamily ATPase
LVKSITTQFCLRDSRRNFGINPHDDPKFFFGRTDIQEELMNRVTKDIALHIPIKLVLVGDYGTGKTHLLRHLQYRVNQDNLGLHVIYLTIGDLSRKSRFSVLYRSIMKAIGMNELIRLLEGLEDKSANLGELEDNLERITREESGSKSVSGMLRQTHLQKNNPSILMDIWRWFLGEPINVAKLNSFGVPDGLTELVDYLKVLMAIGTLYEEIDQHQLLVLVDEAESLRLVSDVEAIANWANAIRELFDDSNSCLGIAFGMGAASIDADDIPEMFNERAVRSRLVGRTVDLRPLAEEDLTSFLRDLISELTIESCTNKIVASHPDATPGSYPFTEDAWEEFIKLVSADFRLSKPRVAIKALNECVAEAFIADRLIIDLDIVAHIPPISE